ncbi:MAG: SDR family NAD(P)-dependent oxidoreductase [Sphingomonadaceae bacterium]
MFEGKVVALTGAASGIGRALALALARAGARLALADKDAAGLAETQALIGNYPVLIRVFDVTDTPALADFLADAAAEWGGLDGIINNAGLTVIAPFADLPREAFERVMAVNFTAVVEGTRAAIPHLRKRGGGFICNIASVFGLIGFPTQTAYNASKFAVRGFTETLALELAETDPAIQVTCVLPGGVRTNVVRSAPVLARLPGTDPDLDLAAAFEEAAGTTPEQAAAVILDGLARRRRRILIGRDARFIALMVRLFPETHMARIGALLRRRRPLKSVPDRPH